MGIDQEPERVGNSSRDRFGRVVTHCPEDNEPEEEPKVRIRASVFFDGTLNNRRNSHIGARGEEPHLFVSGEPDLFVGSYGNDLSNVARLERCLDEVQQEQELDSDGKKIYDHCIKSYIEGIGTISGGLDVPISTTTGDGIAGMIDKVDRSIRQLIRSIDSLGTNKQIEYLHLDAFGFSRGASAARYFIYKCLHNTLLKRRLERRGYSVDSIEFIFIGLFDTVSSFGLDATDQTDDNQILHPHIISRAQRVVQLAAADEHRENFQLTNISSAGNGLEIFLPGVHSDIGGGYRDYSSEQNMIIFKSSECSISVNDERSRLIEKGWYRRTEIEPHRVSSGSPELIVNRRSIRNQYSWIPLHLMADFAGEKKLKFNAILDSDYPVSEGFIGQVKGEIDRYLNNTLRASCTENGTTSLGRSSNPNYWINLNDQWIKDLRHRYLHFSAHYDGVGMDPRFVGTVRERVINSDSSS